MPVREASAQWQGGLKGGSGQMAFGSGAFEGQFNFGSRFEEGAGTNPEELIAAAHAGCFSMAFSAELEAAGHTPDEVETTARVKVEKSDEGFTISESALKTTAKVPGISGDEFQKIAAQAKAGCPVSRALAGVEVTLEAELSS
jgi:osmotically inducible protein OsmC